MIILTENQERILFKEIKKTKTCNISGVVVISVRPSRKGKINGAFGKNKVYAERLTAKFSRAFKGRVLKKARKPNKKQK